MQRKIKSYPPLTHAEDLKQICQPLQQLDIHYFAHVHINSQEQFSAIGLRPEFVKLYLEKEYYNYDIHMAKTQAKESYVLWDFIDLDKQSRALEDDSNAFNIYHSFTIIQSSEKEKNYFHFATDSAKNINNTYLQKIDTLKRFILYFKSAINEHKQLSTSHNYKFSIAADNVDFFTKSPSTEIEPLPLNRIYSNKQGAYLTQREFQCLHYLSSAMTIDQIAKLLKITPRTVKAHIANIKTKTGCATLFQLGALYQQLQDWAY